MSENNNQINENSKDNNEPQKRQEEEKNKTQKKDVTEEKVNELKSIYNQMIKLRKQNLEGYKKIENSK